MMLIHTSNIQHISLWVRIMGAAGIEKVSRPFLTDYDSACRCQEPIKLCVFTLLSSQLLPHGHKGNFSSLVPKGLSTFSSKMVYKVATWNLGGATVKFRKTELSKNHLNTFALQLTNYVARNGSFKNLL